MSGTVKLMRLHAPLCQVSGGGTLSSLMEWQRETGMCRIS